MKKMIAALFAAVLMAAGLVTVSSSAALACGCTDASVKTDSEITGTTAVKAGNNPRFTITVEGANNRNPKGTVRLVIKRKGGGYFKARNVYYGGATKTIIGPKLTKLGTYTATIRFVPKANSNFAGSRDVKALKVQR